MGIERSSQHLLFGFSCEKSFSLAKGLNQYNWQRRNGSCDFDYSLCSCWSLAAYKVQLQLLCCQRPKEVQVGEPKVGGSLCQRWNQLTNRHLLLCMQEIMVVGYILVEVTKRYLFFSQHKTVDNFHYLPFCHYSLLSVVPALPCPSLLCCLFFFWVVLLRQTLL